MNDEITPGRHIAEGMLFTLGAAVNGVVDLGLLYATSYVLSEMGYGEFAGLTVTTLGILSYSIYSAIQENEITRYNAMGLVGYLGALTVNNFVQ